MTTPPYLWRRPHTYDDAPIAAMIGITSGAPVPVLCWCYLVFQLSDDSGACVKNESETIMPTPLSMLIESRKTWQFFRLQWTYEENTKRRRCRLKHRGARPPSRGARPAPRGARLTLTRTMQASLSRLTRLRGIDRLWLTSVDSSPFYSVDSSPFHSVDSSSFHSVDSSPFHSVDSSPFHSVDSSPFHSVNSSSFHSVDSSPFHSVDSSSFHLVDSSPFHSVDSSSFHSVDSSPFHYADSYFSSVIYV